MRKTEYLIIALFVIVMILIPATVVNAYEDTFTYGEGDNQITVKKVVTGYSNGDIDFDISNIVLSNEGNYVWAVEKTSSTNTETKWYNLGDINASKKTAKVSLITSNKDMLSLLRSTDTAYLYIKDTKGTDKDTSDDEVIINGLQLDLALPPLYAFEYIIDGSYYIGKQWCSKSTYNIQNVYYKFEMITDENLVNKYMQAVKDGKSISTVFDIKVSDVEAIDNWTACSENGSVSVPAHNKIAKAKLPTDQGAYYLWLKGKDTDSKTVYGCLIVNIDSGGPTVKSIQVTDPKEGTYKTGQTVKITAYFSENITGDSVPTLKIKFGTSPERSLTNGTIKSTYIEYSYDIQDTDVGQIATVSFEGGSIKDATGNVAKLSCPIISGNTIKANVEGTTTTQTDNQDKKEDKTSNDGKTSGDSTGETTQTSVTPTNNGGSTSTQDNKTSDTQKVTPKQDPTEVPTILPNTGRKTIVLVVISFVFLAGVFAYLYFVKFKDVK